MRTAIVLTAATLATSAAQADVVSFVSNNAASTENLGSYAGSLTFTAQSPTTGLLTIMLENLSPTANGGKITGVVFNMHSADAAATATLASATHPFLNTGSESAAPFGTFEAGAALNANWSGGGSPNPGIAVGDTGTFIFNVVASDAGFLSAGSFLSDGLVVRFRGFANGGSDKSPAIPAPAPAILLASGAAAALRRRRNWPCP